MAGVTSAASLEQMQQLAQSNPATLITSLNQSITTLTHNTQQRGWPLIHSTLKSVKDIGMIRVNVMNERNEYVSEPLLNQLDHNNVIQLLEYVLMCLHTPLSTLQQFQPLEKTLVVCFEFLSAVYVCMLDSTYGDDINEQLWADITELLPVLLQQYCTYTKDAYVIRSCINFICELLDRHLLDDSNAADVFQQNTHIVEKLLQPNNSYLVPRQIQRLSQALNLNTFPHVIGHANTVKHSGSSDDIQDFSSDESQQRAAYNAVSMLATKPAEGDDHDLIDLTDDDGVPDRLKHAVNSINNMFDKLVGDVRGDTRPPGNIQDFTQAVNQLKYTNNKPDLPKSSKPSTPMNPFATPTVSTSASSTPRGSGVHTPSNTLTPESLAAYTKAKQKTLFDFNVTGNAAVSSGTNFRPPPLQSHKLTNTLSNKASKPQNDIAKSHKLHTQSNDNADDLEMLEQNYNEAFDTAERMRQQQAARQQQHAEHKQYINNKLSHAELTPVVMNTVQHTHKTTGTDNRTAKPSGPKSDAMKSLKHDIADAGVHGRRTIPVRKPAADAEKQRPLTLAERHLQRVRQKKELMEKGLLPPDKPDSKLVVQTDDDDMHRNIAAPAANGIQKRTNGDIVKAIDARPVINHRTPAQIEADLQAAKRAEEQAKKRQLRRSITTLHKTILKWVYNELDIVVADELKPHLRKPVQSYVSDQHYQKVWLPLLLEETRAGISSAVEQLLTYVRNNAAQQPFVDTDTGSFELITIGGSNVNNDVHIVDAVQKQHSSIDTEKRKNTLFADHDLVLLYPLPLVGEPTADTLQTAPLTTLAHLTMAKDIVDQPSHTANRQHNKTVVYKLQCAWDTTTERGRHLQKQLLLRGSEWCCMKVSNLKTVHREYRALMSIDLVPLCQYILEPIKQVAHVEQISNEAVTFPTHLASMNDSQKIAVTSVLQRKFGFTLIQGPPGTGKTRTIVGLVNMLLLRNRTRLVTTAAQSITDPANTSNALTRILICTPSNAAVDELMTRINASGAILDRNGQQLSFKIVRVGAGAGDNAHELDKLVEQSGSGRSDGRDVRHTMLDRLKGVKEQLNDINEQINTTSLLMNSGGVAGSDDNMDVDSGASGNKITDAATLKSQLDDMHEQRRGLTAELNKIKARLDVQKELSKSSVEESRIAILEHADIVCTTLSGAGMDTFTQLKRAFDTVIIDEAAQSVELSSLIPLKYKCRQCVLVGDPMQLPATILSQTAVQYNYNQSMFQRLMLCGLPVNVLNVQYRMCPMVRQWPSLYFYDNKLVDGPNVVNDKILTYKHNAATELVDLRLSPYVLFNVPHSVESRQSKSVKNIVEARIICQIYEFLHKHLHDKHLRPADRKRGDTAGSNSDFASRVGIITPYKQQAYEIRRQLTQASKQTGIDMSNVEINTVDSYQGREKDYILFTCVRTPQSNSGIGFLSEFSRLNVALTRCKLGLYVVGNFGRLQYSDAMFGSLYENAVHRGCVVNVPQHKDTHLFAANPGSESSLLRCAPDDNGVITVPPYLHSVITQSPYYVSVDALKRSNGKLDEVDMDDGIEKVYGIKDRRKPAPPDTNMSDSQRCKPSAPRVAASARVNDNVITTKGSATKTAKPTSSPSSSTKRARIPKQTNAANETTESAPNSSALQRRNSGEVKRTAAVEMPQMQATKPVVDSKPSAAPSWLASSNAVHKRPAPAVVTKQAPVAKKQFTGGNYRR